jgi:hypothetical protein
MLSAIPWITDSTTEQNEVTTRNLLTSEPSFWSLDGHCCSIYDPVLTKNIWSAVERH